MSIEEDASEWLGCPTPLEMYQHQCALLEDELIQTEAMLRKARANVAGLVQMNDLLATGKASAEVALRKALDRISAMKNEPSDRGSFRPIDLIIHTARPTNRHVGDNDFLRDIRVTHQRAAPKVEQPLGNFESAHRGLKRDHGRHGGADPRHNPGRLVRQLGQPLGDIGQPIRHLVSDWPECVTNGAHGLVHTLGHFRPFLRRRLPAFLKVLIKNPFDIGRVFLERGVQLFVLHVGR